MHPERTALARVAYEAYARRTYRSHAPTWDELDSEEQRAWGHAAWAAADALPLATLKVLEEQAKARTGTSPAPRNPRAFR